MDDTWETANQLDPTNPKDAWCDYDNDQILNLFEFQLQTDPNEFASPIIQQFTPQNTQEEFATLMNSGINNLVVIRMSAGTYNLFYNIESSGRLIASSDYKIMIQGGWNNDFTAYDPFSYSTIFDGQDSRNILVLDTRENRQVTFILEGVEITKSGNGVKEGAVEIIDWAGTGQFSIYNCSFYNNGYGSDSPSNSGLALGVFWTQEMVNGNFYLVNTSIVNNRNGLYGQLSAFTTGDWHIINSTLTNALQASILEIEGTSQIPQAITIDILNSIFWEDSLDYPVYMREALNTQMNLSYSNIDDIYNPDNLLDLNTNNTVTNIVPAFIDTTVVHFELQTQSPLKESGIDIGLPFEGTLPDLGVNQIVHNQISVDTIITSPTCLGMDGKIELIPLDGKGGLTLSLNDLDYQTEFIFNNLPIGSYTLYVSRDETCQKMQIPFELNEAEQQFRSESATFCANENYMLPDGMIVTEPGIYNNLLIDSENCEVNIETTLIALETYEMTNNINICEGMTYELPDGQIIMEEGLYTSNFISNFGCDSIITTNLTVTSAVTNSMSESICEGESYTLPDGSEVTESNIYMISMFNEQGCLELIELDLTVHDQYQTTQNIAICEGQTYTIPDGTIISNAGMYQSNFQSTQNCDSIIITNLTVDSIPIIQNNVSICKGSTYTLEDGSIKDTEGTYIVETSDADGCIVSYQTKITIDEVSQSTLDIEICQGQNYTLPDGKEVNTTGSYENTLQSTQGCDSIVIINLTINETPVNQKQVSICEGGTYQLENDSIVSTTGNYTINLVDEMSGCTTVFETILTIDDVFQSTQDINICEGQTYTLPNGMEVDSSGTYETTLPSTQSCDSLIITNLTINETPINQKEVSICEGGTYQLENDSIVSTVGSYTVNLVDEISGCATVFETILTIDDALQSTQDINICEGQTYTLPDGMVVDLQGTYESTLQSVQGCDSNVVINLNLISIDIDLPEKLILESNGVEIKSAVQSTHPVEFLWSPSEGLSCVICLEPFAAPTETTTYQLEVTDTLNRCSKKAFVQVIKVNDKPIVANAFSPNQDGVNDYLIPQNLHLEVNFLFAVYNRWGKQLFETQSITNGWDGTFKNQKQPVGVYIWLLQYEKKDGNRLQIQGNVTLIR